jgi:DNA-directed RNA polymerase specialized sigma subunit
MEKGYYVDNSKLYDVLCDYKKKYINTVEIGEEKPRIPEYVGEAILKIAQRLSTKPQFKNYPYRDDMISDGYMNCLLYIDNFDPGKSSNPFAYFTQIIYYAFLRKIQGEKKHLYIQYKLQENNDFGNHNVDHQPSDDIDKMQPRKNMMDPGKVHTFINDFENYMQGKKK